MTSSASGEASETVIGQSTGAFFGLSVAEVKIASRWYQEKLGSSPAHACFGFALALYARHYCASSGGEEQFCFT